MNRELLSARTGASGKENGISFASCFLQEVKYALVIKVGIVVVHASLVTSVKPFHIHGNSLAEVGLEAVNSHIQQSLQLVGIPFAGCGIGKIHQAHSGLPVIGLPYPSAVGSLYQIAVLRAFLKERGSLGNIRIDPDTDLQSFVMVSLQHSFRIREYSLVPCKITPLEFLHPEAVKMKYAQGDIPVGHSLDKGACCLLIVIRGKGGGKPESEAPCGRKGRTPGISRIGFQDFLGGGSVNKAVTQFFAGYGEANVFHFFTRHFKGNVVGMIDVDSIAFICHIERNALIGNLGSGTAVFIPGIHNLSVFHERGESFTETVYVFSYLQGKFIYHIRFSVFCQVILRREHGGRRSVPAGIAQVMEAASGKLFSFRFKIIAPFLQADMHGNLSRLHNGFFFPDFHTDLLHLRMLGAHGFLLIIAFMVP